MYRKIRIKFNRINSFQFAVYIPVRITYGSENLAFIATENDNGGLRGKRDGTRQQDATAE